jgi:hypothetical protein
LLESIACDWSVFAAALGRLLPVSSFAQQPPPQPFQFPQFNVALFTKTAAFERFMRAGNGYVGVHSAADTEYDREWYTKMVGHMFVVHPKIQTATLEVRDRNLPVRTASRIASCSPTSGMNSTRRACRTCVACSRSTYQPVKPAAGPSAELVSGVRRRPRSTPRSVHIPENHSDSLFLHHLYGGIYWAATGKGFKAK